MFYIFDQFQEDIAICPTLESAQDLIRQLQDLDKSLGLDIAYSVFYLKL